MHRFFINSRQVENNSVVFEKKDEHHIRHVLRLKKGNRVHVWDETEQEYEVELIQVEQEIIKGTIINRSSPQSQLKLNIVLGQALPKAKKFDFIIEKATELGVAGITPLTTERVTVKLKEKESQHKIERWQKIAYSAARQCRRNNIPQINPLSNLREFCLRHQSDEVKIVFYEGEKKNNLKEVLQPNLQKGRIALIIGPEGGFSLRELELMQAFGFTPLKLGERILRTETVSICVLSILQFLWGDLG